MNRSSIAALVLAVTAWPAASQAIYRCGSEYSQQPCEGGRSIEAGTAPSDAQARAASEQAKRNGKLADQMERDRLAQEKRVAGPSMLVTGRKEVALKPRPPAGKAKKPPADFTAVSPPRKSG